MDLMGINKFYLIRLHLKSSHPKASDSRGLCKPEVTSSHLSLGFDLRNGRTAQQICLGFKGQWSVDFDVFVVAERYNETWPDVRSIMTRTSAEGTAVSTTGPGVDQGCAACNLDLLACVVATIYAF